MNRATSMEIFPSKINAEIAVQRFVAMNMMNKCAKFHKDSPSDEKVKLNLPSAIELLETAVFVSNFVLKPREQLWWHI